MFQGLKSAFSRWFGDTPARPETAKPAVRPDAPLSAPQPAPPAGSVQPELRREPRVETAPVTPRPAVAPAKPAENNAPKTEAAQEPVLVQREVLDGEMGVVGYDFSLREDLVSGVRSNAPPVRDFLGRMLVDQLSTLDTGLLRNRAAYLQLPERSILRLGIGRLPSRSCVLVAPTNAEQKADGGTREALDALRASGREIWLDDCLGTPWFNSLADLATGAVVRLALRMPNETADLIEASRKRHTGLKYGAWDVATTEDFEMARSLGCRRFSGAFVTRREDWTRNEMSPQMLQVARLINKVREEADMRTIAAVLKQDMALSYRLLRYVNNAAYGLNHQISSIEQGLLVLGQNQLDRWLTLLLLSGGAMGNTALTEMALARARFLELVGASRCTPEQCEQLFVLGLFSMLDLALKVPLEAAIQPLYLPEAMSRALLRREGPFGPYLSLADACERGQAQGIIKFALMLGQTTTKITARQIEALEWVAKITTQAQGALSTDDAPGAPGAPSAQKQKAR